MAVYRITKVRKSALHGHITYVAFRKDTGLRLKKLRTASMTQVRQMMATHHFYTFSLSMQEAAEVKPFTATHNGQRIETIKSASDAAQDNNLDNLSSF